MNKYIISIDSNSNIQYIGEYHEYLNILNKLEKFNKDNNKAVFTEFLNSQMFLIHEEDIYNSIVNIYTNYYRKYIIEAELRALPFKNYKIGKSSRA